MKTYLIADTHFGHEAVIRYESRPFPNSNDMDSALIGNWNRKVSSHDKIFVLGDFSFHNAENTKAIVKKLRGYKILVMGNHDTGHSAKWWLEAGFDEVCKYPIILDEFWILSHEPLYVNAHMPYANIFGHVHNRPEFKDLSQQTFCVSVERIGYAPIDFEEVKLKITEAS